ncbi:MAG: hypothetical protein IRZ31_20375 [Thermogemmatispora sp.]|uniref:hypothetical protein n=1 Tax=Thermogemmatispora sp. TaxID=1968838 RepID=UPI00262F328C|nr:hypothetical protein [Thermogemmatispora sp.]MBX5459256.1 hypothetical protein [Thermogemmatispora sp.]
MTSTSSFSQPAAEVGWTAFVLTRIVRSQVSSVLKREGFRLSFSLPACRRRWGWLPAQYHYTDAAGTEVIWLSGQDPEAREQDPMAPEHRSRFWVYAARRAPERAELILMRLRQAWGLDWRPVTAQNPLRPTS